MVTENVMNAAIGKHINMVRPRLEEMEINFRTLRQGGLITREYRADRWNLWLNKDDIIESVNKG